MVYRFRAGAPRRPPPPVGTIITAWCCAVRALMERLWAVWRAEYVKVAAREDVECIFCELPKRGEDRESLILTRGERAFVLLNRFPYNPGHLMVAPYRHVPSLEDLTPEEALELWELTVKSMRALRKAFSPHGFNVGVNVGRVAGAGFEGHVHVHVVPRWNGDTNFMPVVANTKVISESLERVYEELKAAMEET